MFEKRKYSSPNLQYHGSKLNESFGKIEVIMINKLHCFRYHKRFNTRDREYYILWSSRFYALTGWIRRDDRKFQIWAISSHQKWKLTLRSVDRYIFKPFCLIIDDGDRNVVLSILMSYWNFMNYTDSRSQTYVKNVRFFTWSVLSKKKKSVRRSNINDDFISSYRIDKRTQRWNLHYEIFADLFCF